MAREVLGGIDLDPASNDYAQTSIKAKTYYTKQKDGLKEPWFGRIWCNPPYGSPEVRLLARTFLENAIPSSMVAKASLVIKLSTLLPLCYCSIALVQKGTKNVFPSCGRFVKLTKELLL